MEEKDVGTLYSLSSKLVGAVAYVDMSWHTMQVAKKLDNHGPPAKWQILPNVVKDMSDTVA